MHRCKGKVKVSRVGGWKAWRRWPVPTWVTEAFVAGAHAAAGAVSAGAQGAEVNQLGTGGPREARAAAAGEAHPVHEAGRVVLARRRGARIHLLFARGAEVPCRETQTEGRGKKTKPCVPAITHNLGPRFFSPL